MFKVDLKLYFFVVLFIFLGFHTIYSFEDNSIFLQDLLQKCRTKGLQPLPEDDKLTSFQKSMFSNKDSKFKFTKEQIELGKTLYFDPRLSGSKQYSCNSCHNLSLGGSSYVKHNDLNPYKLNAPTIYNALFNDVAYYKGNISNKDTNEGNKTKFISKNVLARATLNALTAKDEMNSKIEDVIKHISNSEEYMILFRKAYDSKVKVNKDIIAESIAGFIMTLNTFSRYDDFLVGNLKAISIDEARGLETFINKGCVSCHTGINLGGTMQPFEVMKDYKYANIGGMTSDNNKMLKVPTLRNITLTMPYFHNGGFDKLEDSIKEMGKMQIGIDLSPKDIKSIMLFFNTLRGNMGDLELPILPRMEM